MRGKKGERHADPLDPPRRRANKQRGHGTYDNDRPPIVGTVGRYSGQWRLRVRHPTDGKTLQPGAPVPLVRNRIVFDAYRGVRNSRYAVTPDGQRFLIPEPVEGGKPPSIRVVLNWSAAFAPKRSVKAK